MYYTLFTAVQTCVLTFPQNICRNGSPHILSLGYQQVDRALVSDNESTCSILSQLRGNRGLLVAGTKNVENYYPNSIATYVNGQLWQKLLGRFVNVQADLVLKFEKYQFQLVYLITIVLVVSIGSTVRQHYMQYFVSFNALKYTYIVNCLEMRK